MRIGLIVFDMDGVIANSEERWFAAELAYISSLVPGWNETAQRRQIGRSAIATHRTLVRDYGLELDSVEFLNHYEEMADTVYATCAIEPGLVETLDELAGIGCRLALCTSSTQRWAELLLGRLGSEPRFAPIVTSTSFPGPGKPSPDIYLEVLSRAGLPASQAVAVEDSGIGITAAKHAGVRTIGYLNGFNNPSDLSDGDWMATSMTEVTELVRRLLSE